jgi:hypothetical protein
LQSNANDSEHPLHYVEVGTWSTGKLTLDTSAIRFFSDQRLLEDINVHRFCSESCPVGHIKVTFVLSQSLTKSFLFSFRNTLTKKDVVGNVIHAEMLLSSMKPLASLVQPVSGLMMIIQVFTSQSSH